ncbi:orotate phosphoribosyltransferase [Jeotgalibaca caeni]|uniref:orotate phosphoribosyltransferase n=1 Tax=Jeotgalibaca caeni TaxID=3028623 RepID=UPI00237E1068|nr:orotate phosphoribosyltransferase [Jeotgalibaca caeni]MDE1549402.1 orotate phosphoribosyltransferase [Jeotgalibaca caeni]
MNKLESAATFANLLLQCEAVSLSPKDPYTWASGIKSPIYCDNRITMSYPAVRKQIAQGLAAMIREQHPAVEVIAGTATAGIPHAAWVAAELDLPMIYIRGKAKGHGKQNQIEGRLEQGAKVVCIEDLISTGGSVLDAAHAVEAAGGEVLGCAAIFTYQLAAAEENFVSAGFQLHTLSNYTALMEEAAKQEIITENDKALLVEWRKNPEAWMKE